MMYILKRGISLLAAMLLLISCASALLLVQTPVSAADSGITTASDLKSAVNRLSSSSTKEEVLAVARQVAGLSDSQKRKVTSSVITDLAKYYNTVCGVSPSSGKDNVDVDHGDEKSSRRIDEDESYAYGVSATWADGRSNGRTLQIDQEESSGDVLLRMDLSGFKGPIYVNLEMEKKPFSSSNDYYVKWDGHKIDASVSSNRVRFVAPDEGTYRLYRDRDNDDDDDDDDDRRYSSNNSSSSTTGLDSFWKSAVTNIKNAAVGDRVRVSLGTRTTVPTQVLQALKGKDATLALYESTGNIISIYGKDVTVPSGSSVSVATLRSTYDKDASSSSSSSAASGTTSSGASGLGGGLSALPNGLGGSTTVGGTTTPNAGGAPTSVFPSPLPVTAYPKTPSVPATPPASSASSSEASSSEDAPSEEESSSLALPVDFQQNQEAENVAIREPVDMPQFQDAAAGGSRIQRVVSRVGTAGVLVFMGMVGLTAALGGGLLTYAILSRKED